MKKCILGIVAFVMMAVPCVVSASAVDTTLSTSDTHIVTEEIEEPVEKDINLISSGSTYVDSGTVKTDIYNEWSSQSDAIIVDSDDFVNVASISVRIKVSGMETPFDAWIRYADPEWQYVYWSKSDEDTGTTSDIANVNKDGYYVINLTVGGYDLNDPSIWGYPNGLIYLGIDTDLSAEDESDIPSIAIDAIRINGVLEDTDGDAKFTYDELDDGTLKIVGCAGYGPELEIPSQIDGKKVTKIGNYAFSGISTTKSITIPDGVTHIGEGAFSYCSSLTSVTIPDGIKEIGSEAFYECSSLETINLPAGITYIGADAFDGCSLTNLSFFKHTLGHKIAYEMGITTEGYLSTLENEDGTLRVGDFTGNETSIEIPSEINGKKVTGVFYLHGTHPNATSVTIPASVVEIYLDNDQNTPFKSISVDSSNIYYSSADGVLFNKDKTELLFYPAGKTNTSYTVPDGVTKISNYAFNNCAILEEINVPASLTALGIEFKNYGFDALADSGVKAINVDKNNLTYASIDGIVYSNDKKNVITCPPKYVGEVNIADGTVNILEEAFYGCSGITKVTFPSTLKLIYNFSFWGCSSLTAIEIPEGVTEIGTAAFIACKNLADISLPSTLYFMGYKAFHGTAAYNSQEDIVVIDKWLVDGSGSEIPDGIIGISGGGNVPPLEEEATFHFTGNNLILPEGLLYISRSAFYGMGISNEPMSLLIPESVIYIGDILRLDSYSEAGKEAIINNLTIYCYEGTAGEKFAIKYGLKYKYVKGDPSAVTGFKSPSKSSTAIRLGWDKNDTADGYIIEQYTNSGWVQIADITDASTVTYKVTDLVPGTAYKFRMRAYNAGGEGSNTATLTVNTMMTAVKGFTSPSKSATAIRLNWTKNAYATGYVIEQYTNSGWVQIADITDNTTVTYKVTGLVPGTAYKFRMKAYSVTKYGETVYGDKTATLTINTQMTAVKGFTSPSKSTTAIRLNWTKNAYATGYVIEQYTSDGWVQIADITDKATTTYKVTGLASGTAYKFRMKAYSVTKYGETIYGDKTATLTVNTQASAVTGLKVKSKSDKAIRLAWTKNTAVDGYVIEQYVDGKWVQIADIDSYATTEYKVTGLTSGTAYKFRMKAYAVTKYGETTYSAYTSTLTASTM